MVEVAGIEPASKKPNMSESTMLSCLCSRLCMVKDNQTHASQAQGLSRKL